MLTHDDVIDALRPEPPALDPAWSDQTLSRILAQSPQTPRQVTRPRRTRTRVALLGVAAALPLTAGVGLAAASSGLLPQAFDNVFAHWGIGNPDEGIAPVDLDSVRRAATAAGPDGQIFTVVAAGTKGGSTCHTALFETQASAAEPRPTAFIDVTDNWCAPEQTGSFGGVSLTNTDGYSAFHVSAGEAVDAVLRTTSGDRYPVILVDGYFWGWFPQGEAATLVAHDADGVPQGRAILAE